MKPHPLKRAVADLIDGVILIGIKLIIAGSFAGLTFLFRELGDVGEILIVSLWIFYFIIITFVFRSLTESC